MKPDPGTCEIRNLVNNRENARIQTEVCDGTNFRFSFDAPRPPIIVKSHGEPVDMNDELATITCDRCQTRLRVKPGLLKVMKTIKCTKCGHHIPVVPTASPPPAEPPPVPAPAPTRETSAAPESSPESIPPSAPAPAPLRNSEEELEALRLKLRAAEHELAESDARIASLQELWHGKEIELREMSARLHKAEAEAKTALSIRDEFLARAKNELAIYLVGERDASLSRFTELEKRLLALHPDAPTR